MALFKKESLETLKQKVDLFELLSSYIDLKKAGASYKALCPFHDERSPSFTLQRGDSSYHCFGCGAHGDAIRFLMEHQKLSFVEAVTTLADRFRVPLELIEEEEKGTPKKLLKQVLEEAAHFFISLFSMLSRLKRRYATFMAAT